jgi:uncharacterized protein YfdQ (DUF2303 family)
MDNTAVQAIGNLAIAAEKANRLDTSVPAIVLRDEGGQQCVKSIEHLQPHRSRFRGRFNTNSLQDFAQYVTARAGVGNGFIDAASLAATVIFDLHVSADGTPADSKSAPVFPGHAEHRATLKLDRTPAFAALNEAITCKFSQKGITEWLEDWWDYLAADYPGDGGTNPVANDPQRMSQALTALRKVKVKATGESVHTDKDFGASRSALEDVEASSEVGLPRGFRFSCQPCEDLPGMTFYLRLGVVPDAEKPCFHLRWGKRGTDIEAIGQAFKTKLRDTIGDAATMLIGSFEPGK